MHIQNWDHHQKLRTNEKTESSEQLRQELDLLQSIMNSTGKAHIAFLDRNFNFVRVNKSYCEGCDYSAKELIGKNHFELFPHEENEAIFRKVRDSGEPVQFHDKAFEYPDDTERGTTWWDWTLVPVKDGGRVAGVVLSLTETTERVLAEKALKASEARYRRLTENLPEIAVLSFDSNMRLLAAGGKVLRRHDVEVESIVGRTVEQTISKENSAHYLDRCERALEGIESRFEHEYGGAHYAAHILPLDNGNGAPEGMAIIHDITEAKKREAETAKQVKYLEQFAYAVAHDMKAPLSSIIKLVTWLAEDLGDSLEPKIREYIELLKGRTGRLQNHVDGILAYSRVGRRSVRNSNVDLTELISTIVNDNIEPNSRITVSVKPGMPVIVTNKAALQQVFTNLIFNAVRHHHREDGNVEISWESAKNGYRFTVADDGPGIEPEYQEQVFGFFTTLQSRDNHEGSGIGLAIVKRVVELQGGEISLESAPGDGSRFSFYWPLTTEE